jgi:methanogenic corrinoid protein MtbC1
VSGLAYVRLLMVLMGGTTVSITIWFDKIGTDAYFCGSTLKAFVKKKL